MSHLSQDSPRPGGGPGPEDAGLTLRTLSGFTWAFLTSGGQALLSLAIMMTLSRLLTPQDFGMVAIALVFIALAETAGRSGLGPALVQRADLTASHIAAALTLAVAVAVPLTATLWILAPLLCSLVGEPAAAPVLRILSLSVALSGAGLVSEHLLYRRLRFRALMTAAILSQAVGNGLVAIVLALMDRGVEALVWGVVARQAVFSAAVILLEPVPPRLFAGRREIADLLRTGAGFSAIAVFTFLANRGLNLVIARTLGAAALGLYTRAHALAVVSARLGPVMAKVLLPSMARRQHRVERLRAVHRGGIEMLSLAVVPASLMIAMTAPEIIAVVLGPQWEGAAPALRILALAGVLQAFSALHVPVIRSLGAVYRETWRRALFFVLLMAGAWLASRWGLAAVAAAAVAAGVVLQGLLAHWRWTSSAHAGQACCAVSSRRCGPACGRPRRCGSRPPEPAAPPCRRSWRWRSSWRSGVRRRERQPGLRRISRDRPPRTGRWRSCRSTTWGGRDRGCAPSSPTWRGAGRRHRPARRFRTGRPRLSCRGRARRPGAEHDRAAEGPAPPAGHHARAASGCGPPQ